MKVIIVRDTDIRIILLLKVQCNSRLYSYEVDFYKDYVWSSDEIENHDRCIVLLTTFRSFLNVLTVKKELKYVSIDMNQKVGKYSIDNLYTLSWFDSTLSKVKEIKFISIKCISKISSKFFKDKIQLDVYADGLKQIYRKFVFKTSSEEIAINDSVAFQSKLFIRLWYMRYGLKSELKLLGEEVIEDIVLDSSIPFINGQGNYSILLEA